MTFISYAQNFEDVMLWRALKHIKDGFYVDVGANDPILDSVTQAFYIRGWHGINIEPMIAYHERLSRARPLDINLPVAVADEEGELTFYEIPESGLSTFDKVTAEKHHEVGWSVIERKVPVSTLNQIFTIHVSSPIHFLKIDVEGAEKLVLQGLDLSLWRPWIIVIEATIPNSTDLNYETWEPLILTADYEFVYFDGLNRFYISREHSELNQFFTTPPNFFDNFLSVHYQNALSELARTSAELEQTKSELVQTKSELEQTKSELEQTKSELEQTKSELEQTKSELEQTKSELERSENINLELQLHLSKIYGSRSWRITQPLRWLYLQRELLHEYGLYARSKAFFRRLFPRRNTRPGKGMPREHEKNANSSDDNAESEADHLARQTNSDLHNQRAISGRRLTISGKFKQAIRPWIVSIIKLASGYARRTPRFKRLTLRFLNKYPGIELQLRRFYQESRSENQLKPTTWDTMSVDSEASPYKTVGQADLNSSPVGINAKQRTPLEANYHRFTKKA